MTMTPAARPRATGRHASAMKYDLITALGTFGCAGDKHLQRLVLRLITLVVARYNWQADEFTVGQREMAQLWSVDERTVKRDMARLRDMGWLRVKRPATRGRVAVLGLEIDAILATTQGLHERVGPDFIARLDRGADPEPMPRNVVPFPQAPRAEPDSPWAGALSQLHQLRPDLFPLWFAALEPETQDGDWILRAPSRFHATFVATHHQALIEGALRHADPGCRSVQIRPRS